MCVVVCSVVHESWLVSRGVAQCVAQCVAWCRVVSRWLSRVWIRSFGRSGVALVGLDVVVALLWSCGRVGVALALSGVLLALSGAVLVWLVCCVCNWLGSGRGVAVDFSPRLCGFVNGSGVWLWVGRRGGIPGSVPGL